MACPNNIYKNDYKTISMIVDGHNISTTKDNITLPKTIASYGYTTSNGSVAPYGYVASNGSVVNLNDLLVKNYKDSKSIRSYFFDRYKIWKVVYNGPATVVFFKDGSKSAVKIASGSDIDIYDDRRSAVMYAVLKQIYGSRWRKELKRYHYILECCLPMDIVEEYYCDLDNVYLRMMIERFDREHETDISDQITAIEFVRLLNWAEFEYSDKLVIEDSDFSPENRRKKNGRC